MWLENYIKKKILDELKNRFIGHLKNKRARLISKSDDLFESLEFHLKQTELWSSDISFKDNKTPKSLDNTYIELDTYVSPRKGLTRTNQSQSTTLSDFIKLNLSTYNLTILGQPGAGKTTSVKKLCRRVNHDPEFLKDFKFPLLIRLRELKSDSILYKLFDILGFTLEIEVGEKTYLIDKENFKMHKTIFLKYFIKFLDGLNSIIIFDGLDEVDELKRKNIIDELNELGYSLQKSRFVLTSRTGEFNYSITNCIDVEIRHLNNKQIFEFSSKWLGDNEKSKIFCEKILESPFADTTIRPLNLAHLLAIFERENDIPDKPKTVYRKIVNLLLEEWDIQRRIIRKSKYGNFEIDRKFEFLSNLSFELTTNYNTSVFSNEQLEEIYLILCDNYKLPKGEVNKVVNEIEHHTGLIIQSGYESYEFSHKSIQEFMTASHLVGLKKIPKRTTLINIPNELAICIAISTNATEYFSDLILHDLKQFKFSQDFTETLLNRILIEKVDLTQNVFSSIALLLIFTKYMQENFEDKNKKVNLELFYKFSTLAAFNSTISYVQEYYYFSDTTVNLSDSIQVLKRKETMDEELKDYLPIKLYTMEGLLN